MSQLKSARFRVASQKTLAGSMCVAREPGSARRRRERLLRSMLRHERLAVAIALAEELRHSACRTVPEEEEVEQYAALRGQTPAKARWRAQDQPFGGLAARCGRPQALVDPLPQGAVRRPFCSCFHVLLFVLPLVVCGPAHDDSTAAFLLAQTHLERQKEEGAGEEERRGEEKGGEGEGDAQREGAPRHAAH